MIYKSSLLLVLLLSRPSRVNSVQPHRREPTRLRRPWDSPGKNTGVGCHFLQCMKVKSETEVARSCPTLRNPMDCSLPGHSVHGIFQARVLEWFAIASSISQLNIKQLNICVGPQKENLSVWRGQKNKLNHCLQFSKIDKTPKHEFQNQEFQTPNTINMANTHQYSLC